MTTLDILDRLIAFDTVSHRSNLPLIHHVRDLLTGHGIDCTLIPDASGEKANLLARTGPADTPGVVLSGHVDVVPVEGQAWTRPPFTLTREGSRLYGRGTTDMKGFDACAIAAMIAAQGRTLKVPLILSLSHDEEVGCRGVGSLIDRLEGGPRHRFCLVGEPTSLIAATGHKGKVALRVSCTGRGGHSSGAPLALNAIHLAVDFVGKVRGIQARIAAEGPFDTDYEVPYTTLHAGRIEGGVQVNIVADRCVLDMEIRFLAGHDPDMLIAELEDAAEAIVAPLRPAFPEAAIAIARQWSYPGLDTPRDAVAVAMVQDLARTDGTLKVGYGTEGGLFSARLGLSTAVCGPGSMAQGHVPDEYIETDQIEACDSMLSRLVGRCEAGF